MRGVWKKSGPFKSAFFKLYAVQSTGDMLVYVLYTLMKLVSVSPSIASTSLEFPILISSTISLFLTYLHISIATFIAFNRYIVLSRPLDKAHWSLTRVNLCMLPLVVCSALGVAHHVAAEQRIVRTPALPHSIAALYPWLTWFYKYEHCSPIDG
ncbi:hypothetical protein AAVH_19641 [Aphelenchoides avenae]|nr:hypothetical protein AAVH_19641 [Aphelenchus avenae]